MQILFEEVSFPRIMSSSASVHFLEGLKFQDWLTLNTESGEKWNEVTDHREHAISSSIYSISGWSSTMHPACKVHGYKVILDVRSSFASAEWLVYQ